jgi:predicted secreted protein
MTTFTGQAGTLRNSTNAIAEVRNFEISVSADTVEDTVMTDTWKTNKAMQKSWTASVECYFDTSNAAQNGFSVGTTVAFQGYPSSAAATVGNASFTGSAIVTGRTIKSSHDGLVELSLTLIGDGALVETTM